MTTPRCVGCDQWKGGKRWRGRAGCPIPPGWQRTLPQRDPPVDHSQSTLICILCYKQWGHLKEAFREGATIGPDGVATPIGYKPGTATYSTKSHKKHSSGSLNRKRNRSEMSSDASYDGSDMDDDEDQMGDPNSSASDSYSTWAPHSPSSHDFDHMSAFSDSIYGGSGSRPSSPSGYSSLYSHRSSRKGNPCISIQASPIGSPSPSPLISLFAARTNTSHINFGSSILPKLSNPAVPIRTPEPKRPKLQEVESMY